MRPGRLVLNVRKSAHWLKFSTRKPHSFIVNLNKSLDHWGPSSDEIFDNSDLIVHPNKATFLDMAEIQRDRKMDGISLLPVLTGNRNKNERESLIYHIDTGNKPEAEIRGNKHLQQLIHHSEIANSSVTYSFAIRYKNYKYIKSIHNLRVNVFPYRVFNNHWQWAAPHNWSGQEVDIQDGNFSAPCQDIFKIHQIDYIIYSKV